MDVFRIVVCFLLSWNSNATTSSTKRQKRIGRQDGWLHCLLALFVVLFVAAVSTFVVVVQIMSAMRQMPFVRSRLPLNHSGVEFDVDSDVVTPSSLIVVQIRYKDMDGLDAAKDETAEVRGWEDGVTAWCRRRRRRLSDLDS